MKKLNGALFSVAIKCHYPPIEVKLANDLSFRVGESHGVVGLAAHASSLA
jgi:hypothetical protein